MARSVGDYAVKAVGVTAEPEVTPLYSSTPIYYPPPLYLCRKSSRRDSRTRGDTPTLAHIYYPLYSPPPPLPLHSTYAVKAVGVTAEPEVTPLPLYHCI